MAGEIVAVGEDVKGWKLEELDVRDNEIGRLPAEVGLLPMDVFLVDGNVYVFVVTLYTIMTVLTSVS